MNSTLEELRHGVVVEHLFLSLAESCLFDFLLQASLKIVNLLALFFDPAVLVFVLDFFFFFALFWWVFFL